MRKREDEKNHMCVHFKDVAKKLGVLERAEARRLSKQEKEESEKKEIGRRSQKKKRKIQK
jgi:hypothetical protein